MGRGKTTAIVSEGRKKLHTTYDDGSEQVEEYDVRSDELLVRKVRKPTMMGQPGEWAYQVGQAAATTRARNAKTLIAESSVNVG